MPEEKRVFDVSKPGHTNPSATSKPVIVGHHPVMNDPMVRSDDSPAPARITVHGENEAPEKVPEEPGLRLEAEPKTAEALPPKPIPEPVNYDNEHPESLSAPVEVSAAGIIEPVPAVQPPAQNPISPQMPYENRENPAESPAPTVPDAPPEEEPAPAPQPPSEVAGLRVGGPKRRRSPVAWLILIILLLLVAGYLLIDSGVIKSSLNLPVHFFKQKAPAVSPPTPTTNSNQPAAPPVPAGFSQYKLADTSITFAAPTAWGRPTSNPEQGYSARGGANKTDGTYAYIVDFPGNKDVEIAVTSSQYLPPARTTLYYDYLQWCTGTNDGKIYLSILHFTTANKIDTPSTVTCDQGPVTGAVKLDSTTIVQPKAKYLNGQLLGDLYTKNLPNADLPVFRVKDAKSANSADIKQLLSTVQEPAQASSGASSSSSSP